MRVALTGCSGFIGSVIARHLHDAGHQVTGLVRESSRRDHIEPWIDRFVVGGQDDDTAWPALLEGADAVVHNSVDWRILKGTPDLRRHLDSNVSASVRLLYAAAPRQFLFISSVAVHHAMSDRWDGQIDAEHPLRPGNLYGAGKAAVEAFLWAAHAEHKLPFCAFRPAAVYGIDPSLKRSIGYPFVQQLRRGEAFTRAGGGKFVHVDDVAGAVLAALGNQDANGRLFNMADCYARWSDLATMIAEHLGVEASIDASSVPTSRNVFLKDEVQSLGISMDRGHDGIRDYLRTLIDAIDAAD